MTNIVFTPLNISNNTIITTPKNKNIVLPGVTTIVQNKIINHLTIMSEHSVGLIHTHEQQTIFNINNIDLRKVIEKRAKSKKDSDSSYKVHELRFIAKNINIAGSNIMNKKELVNVIREKVFLIQNNNTD